jgi:hypothetical protein
MYCARCHFKYGVIKHPWIEDLLKKQNMTEEVIFSHEAADRFIDGGKDSKDPNSWFYYQRILRGYFILGLVGAVSFYLGALIIEIQKAT